MLLQNNKVRSWKKGQIFLFIEDLAFFILKKDEKAVN